MYIKQFDGVDETVINDIVTVLMNSDAVTCAIESYDEPYMREEISMYIIPSSYRMAVDFKKLAKAVYDAGYRKDKNEHILCEN